MRAALVVLLALLPARALGGDAAPVASAVPADAYALVDSKAITRAEVAKRARVLGAPEGLALEVLIRERLLEDRLDREGFGPGSVSPEEMARARDELRARAKAYGQDLDAQLATQGLSLADLEPALRLDRAFRKRVEKDATDEALAAAFERWKLALAGEVRARRIVVSFGGAGELAAYQRAQGLLLSILPDGSNVAALARAESSAPLAAITGGDTDWFPAQPGARTVGPPLAPEVVRACFELGRPGLIPFAIRTRDAFEVVFVTGTRFTSPPAFADHRARVRDRFLAERANELFQAWRDEARIERAPDAPRPPEGYPALPPSKR